jgi:hypothetical protein
LLKIHHDNVLSFTFLSKIRNNKLFKTDVSAVWNVWLMKYFSFGLPSQVQTSLLVAWRNPDFIILLLALTAMNFALRMLPERLNHDVCIAAPSGV